MDEQIFHWYELEDDWNRHYIDGFDDGCCWVTDGLARVYGKEWRVNEEQRNRIGVPSALEIECYEPHNIKAYRESQEKRINSHADMVMGSYFYDLYRGYSLAMNLLIDSSGRFGTLLYDHQQRKMLEISKD